MDVVRTPATGWIEVVVGSMFSGKSEELIRRLRRAQIARQRVQIFKPAVDTRYAADHIVSHSELRIPSEAAATAVDLLSQVKNDTEVVGIDEGQFFDSELPAVASALAGIRVSGELFRGASAGPVLYGPHPLRAGILALGWGIVGGAIGALLGGRPADRPGPGADAG